MLDIAMKVFPQFHRHLEIRRVRSKLERDSFPRLQMLLLVSLTGASGFVASYTFLHAGLVEMWLRYLASFAVGYLVFLVLIGAMVFSSFLMLYFMVYSAPALFAELLVDGVLSASLYRRLRGLETRHWLETALRHTALPFVLAATITSASGWAMALYAPEAHSIGDVIVHVRQGS
jgi:hypothetical protein